MSEKATLQYRNKCLEERNQSLEDLIKDKVEVIENLEKEKNEMKKKLDAINSVWSQM